MSYQKLDKAIKKVANYTTLSETPAFNHVKNTIMAAISAIPYIGGPLSILIDKYIPDKKRERLLNFIQDLELLITKIQEKLDYDYIQTEEFAFIFEQTFKSVADNHQKEKLECYKAILLNTLKDPNAIAFEEKELYLKFLNDTTVLHIKVLGMLEQIINREIENPLTGFDGPELIKYNCFPNTKNKTFLNFELNKGSIPDQRTVLGILQKQLGNYPAGLVTLVIEDLERFGVVQRIKAHTPNEDMLIPPELEAKKSNIDLNKFSMLDFSKPRIVLTNFGYRLLSFLKEP
jgi:hypothetical protein